MSFAVKYQESYQAFSLSERQGAEVQYKKQQVRLSKMAIKITCVKFVGGLNLKIHLKENSVNIAR